jgi:hypothetical protein
LLENNIVGIDVPGDKVFDGCQLCAAVQHGCMCTAAGEGISYMLMCCSLQLWRTKQVVWVAVGCYSSLMFIMNRVFGQVVDAQL